MRDRFFTLKELKEFNGEAGKPAYVVYNGKVYDVSNSPLWKKGKHRERHFAGDDLTESMLNATHSEEVLMRFQRADYINAFFNNINWEVVEGRFKAAILLCP